jgi:hypothetical protein
VAAIIFERCLKCPEGLALHQIRLGGEQQARSQQHLLLLAEAGREEQLKLQKQITLLTGSSTVASRIHLAA